MPETDWYEIGVTLANMQRLIDLGLPDPLWEPVSDFTPWSELVTRGDGLVEGLGLPSFRWKFNELTIAQLGELLYYVSTAGVLQASKWVYARTRIPSPNMTDRTFRTYKAVMMCPLEPREAQYTEGRKYRDVEILFINAEDQGS
jgi:hypothetical protein